MEAASCIKAACENSNIIMINPYGELFEPLLGSEIGAHLKKLAEAKGCKILNGHICKKLIGKNGKVNKVLLNNLIELNADMVLITSGYKPNTDFVTDSGLTI